MIDKENTIGILGAGTEGKSAVNYLKAHGYRNLIVFDERSSLEISLPSGVRSEIGKGSFEKIFDCDVLFRSPGIHTKRLNEARKKGIEVTSVTNFFMENCPCPVIGVTGTKGKGTTSTLIKMILEEAGRDVFLGGNIGESPLDFLDKLTDKSLAVLELSSFQLQDLTLSPHAAVILMTTSEHLDYHKDTSEYVEAKTPIVRYQSEDDICVVNSDYDCAEKFLSLTKAQKYTVSRKRKVERGAYEESGKIFYVDEKGGVPSLIAETSKIALVGPHNIENVLAAAVVTRKLGADISSIQKVAYGFRGLPHRLEFVREVNGVKFYNDSFSTTPETSAAAARSFTGGVILIAGGSEKNSDYSEWAKSMNENKNLKAIVLMGVTADRMEKELRKAGGAPNIKILRADSLEEAINAAFKEASSENTIVLSPAAASFDMFKNYKDRGEKFAQTIRRL